MKKQLTLAIEIISVVSGIGVVLSIFIYAYAFGLNGLSYLSIASFSDMLRDSLQVLVVAVLALAATAILFALASYGIRTEARGKNYTSKQLNLRAIKYTVPVAILIFAAFHVSAVIGSQRSANVFSWHQIFNTVCLSLASFSLLHRIFSETSEMSDPAIGLKSFFVVTLGCLIIFSSVWEVRKQFEYGIRADVYPLDSKLCHGGKYTVVWLGKDRMVARCEKVQMFVVKVLN